MKNILVIQQKGGGGKSTIACEIARSLQRTRIPSAFYDLDGQGGCILEPYEDDGAEVAVIDTPGSLSDKMGEWCKASDAIIVPTRCSRMDITPTLRTLDIARANMQAGCSLFIILNQFTRWRSSRDFMEWIAEQDTGAEILTLPQSEQILQASAAGKSIIDFRPHSEPARAALALVNAVRQSVGLMPEII